MENENIIIILVVIAVILAAAVGLMYLKTTGAKPTEIRITSNETLKNGDSLTIQLTDLNKTAISDNITIIIQNSDGSVAVNKTAETNSKGLASFDLDLKKGEYTVNVSFKGNNNFKGSNATQKLTIKEAVTESVSEESYSSSSSSSGGYDKYSAQYGTYIKQYTDSNGVQHIDGANGMHESYNPRTRIFTYDDGNGHISSEYR